MRWTIRPSRMCFLAQNRHKTKPPIRQVTVNKRKYNNDLDPSLGKGVPPDELPNCALSHKSRNVGFYTNYIAAGPHPEQIGNFAIRATDPAHDFLLRIGSAQLGYFFVSHITLDEHMHLAVAAHQSDINLVAPIDAQCLVERTLARINRNRPTAHRG